MRKKGIAMIALMGCLFMGCGKVVNYDLPDNPIVFEQETFANPNDESDDYQSIIYNDRIYVPYGTLSGTLKGTDIEECIGYIKDDLDPASTQMRVMTLNGTDDYLMEYIVEAEMEPPFFYRAIDTADKNIETPKYIEDLGYDYWGE